MSSLSPARPLSFHQTRAIWRIRVRRVAQVAFVLALAFAMTMALLPVPPRLPIDNWSDKAQHMLAFGTLTLLADFAFPTMPRLRIAERLCTIGLLIEVLQSIPELHRDCDVKDWLVELVAIALVQGALWLRWPDRYL